MMKRPKINLMFFLITLVCVVFLLPPASQAESHLTVLTYHGFGTQLSEYFLPPDVFRGQILYMKNNGYNFLSLAEVEEHLRTGDSFPDNAVFITVDDAYLSTYTEAFPFLKKHDIPWALYVYTEVIEEEHPGDYPSFVTWDMLEEMVDAGVYIGNHSHTHSYFLNPRDDYDTWIEEEILKAEEKLEERLDVEITSYAPPYGIYDTYMLDEIRDHTDYNTVLTSDAGVVDQRNDTFLLPRFEIRESTLAVGFLTTIDRRPLPVEEFSPAAGARLDSTPDTIYINLKEPENVLDDLVEIYLLGAGQLDWDWKDRSAGRLVARIPGELKNSWNTVTIRAVDPESRRYRKYSFSFIYSPD